MIFQLWTVFIYVFFGVVLVVLTVALHERLKTKSVGLMQLATPVGLIWAGLVIASGMVASVGLEAVAAVHSKDVAQAASAWVVIGAVQNGLGGGVEIVGGIWVLLISAASESTRRRCPPAPPRSHAQGRSGIRRAPAGGRRAWPEARAAR